MTDGQRWLAIDADLMGKPFTLDLYHRFGWAGIGVWVAFLCACKRSRVPGSVRFLSESDARSQLGILGWDLVDNDGKEWNLTDYWLYTGRKKQTRRTSRGREMNVRATHWERWQHIAGRAREAERKSTSRQQNSRTQRGHNADKARTNVRSNSDSDSDTPQPPNGGQVALRAESQNPQDLRAGLESVRANMPSTPPRKNALP